MGTRLANYVLVQAIYIHTVQYVVTEKISFLFLQSHLPSGVVCASMLMLIKHCVFRECCLTVAVVTSCTRNSTTETQKRFREDLCTRSCFTLQSRCIHPIRNVQTYFSRCTSQGRRSRCGRCGGRRTKVWPAYGAKRMTQPWSAAARPPT